MAIPGSKALGVLSSHARCSTIGASKHYRDRNGSSRHIQCLCCGIDDLVDGLHGKIEGHEFTHRLQTRHRSAGGNSRETGLLHQRTSLVGCTVATVASKCSNEKATSETYDGAASRSPL